MNDILEVLDVVDTVDMYSHASVQVIYRPLMFYGIQFVTTRIYFLKNNAVDQFLCNSINSIIHRFTM